jgi:hypothetical protein
VLFRSLKKKGFCFCFASRHDSQSEIIEEKEEGMDGMRRWAAKRCRLSALKWPNFKCHKLMSFEAVGGGAI